MSIEKMSEKITESNMSIKKQDIDKRVEKNDSTDMSQVNETSNIDSRLESYKDDNGKEYKIGDNLVPNNQYELNGYEYKTDNLGRVKSSEGNLHIKQQEGREIIKDSIDQIGKGDQKKDDQRCHYIADRFGGSSDNGNLFSGNKELNQGSYKKLENLLAKELKMGKDVNCKIMAKYEGDSFRPKEIIYKYSINGEKHMQIFPNGGTK